MAVLPADPTDSPEREELCSDAVSALRQRGSFWWSFLPRTYICDRLVRESREWLSMHMDPPRTPAWVLDGELGEPGLSDGALDALRRRELLGDAATLR